MDRDKKPDEVLDKDRVSDLRKQLIIEDVIYRDKDVDPPNEPSGMDRATVIAKLTVMETELEILDIISEAEEELEELDEEFTEDEEEQFILGLVFPKITNEFYQLVTIVTEFIEYYSAELLKKELIDEKYEESNKTESLVNGRLSADLKEELLMRTGLIDESLRSEMSHVRKLRNKLVHDLSHRMLFKDIDTITVELDRIIETYLKIEDLATDGERVSLGAERPNINEI